MRQLLVRTMKCFNTPTEFTGRNKFVNCRVNLQNEGIDRKAHQLKYATSSMRRPERDQFWDWKLRDARSESDAEVNAHKCAVTLQQGSNFYSQKATQNNESRARRGTNY